MGSFKYSLDIGEYNDPVLVDLDITIANGLTKDDYETIRAALTTIEDTARKYLSE